jgi:hypothetical protein
MGWSRHLPPRSLREQPQILQAAEMLLGIDGCFVKGISRNRKTSLEVVVGRIEVPARNSEVFAVVRHLDGLAAVLPRFASAGSLPRTRKAVKRSGGRSARA